MTIPSLFRTTTLNFITVQDKGKNACRLVLKPSIYWQWQWRKFTLQSLLFLYKIHFENQINRTRYTRLTDSHEIIYPVQDREVKNHTLSIGTSTYRPYVADSIKVALGIGELLFGGHSLFHMPKCPITNDQLPKQPFFIQLYSKNRAMDERYKLR